MHRQALSAALEAIRYQGKSMFFQDLTLAFEKLKESKDFTTNGLIDIQFDEIVKRHTNMTVAVELLTDPEGYYNAYASPPVINQKSVFYADIIKMEGGKEFLKGQRMNEREIKAFSEELKMTVNRATGKVGGVVSRIPMRLYIGKGFLEILTPNQQAAVMLHEVGHLFTYFEIITHTVSSNLAIATASEAFSRTTNVEDKLEIVHQYERIVGRKFDDANSLANAKLDAQGFAVLLLKDDIENNVRAANGAEVYDIRGAEFAADQFATMHGAGKDLALAMDVVYRMMGVKVRQTFSSWVVVQAACTAGVLLSVVLTPFIPRLTRVVLGVVIDVLMSKTVEDRSYDLPKERLTRIKNNLVQVLKNRSLAPDQRTAIHADIQLLDTLAEDMVDRRSLLNWLWISMTSHRRRQYRLTEFQKDLESFVNTNIYVSASKLDHLSTQGA